MHIDLHKNQVQYNTLSNFGQHLAGSKAYQRCAAFETLCKIVKLIWFKNFLVTVAF